MHVVLMRRKYAVCGKKVKWDDQALFGSSRSVDHKIWEGRG